MRSIIHYFAISLMICWVGLAQADETLPPEPDIEATIGAQIDAFLEDDFAKAFTFASPDIQGMFGSSERFGQMVRNGYPMVWRPDDVRYLELRDVAGNLWQRVQILDKFGKIHALDYQMVQTSEGWRINGVQLVMAPGVST